MRGVAGLTRLGCSLLRQWFLTDQRKKEPDGHHSQDLSTLFMSRSNLAEAHRDVHLIVTAAMARCLELCATTIAALLNSRFPLPFRPIQGNLNETWLPAGSKIRIPTPGQSKRSQPTVRRGRRSGRGRSGRRGRPDSHESSRPSPGTGTTAPGTIRDSAALSPKLGIRPREIFLAAAIRARASAKWRSAKSDRGVNHIIESLKEALDEMDEVLETLELVRAQKGADEREIESLRRALRHLQQPRDRARAES